MSDEIVDKMKNLEKKNEKAKLRLQELKKNMKRTEGYSVSLKYQLQYNSTKEKIRRREREITRLLQQKRIHNKESKFKYMFTSLRSSSI